MISTLYVALRLDHQQLEANATRNIGAETLGYTDTISDGMQFIENVTARDVHGKDWSFELSGDPFYDPMNEENIPPPDCRFAVWDENLEQDDCMLNRPTSVVASSSVFSEAPDHMLIRSYKLCRTNAMVSDFTRVTSEGDLEMQRQIITNGMMNGIQAESHSGPENVDDDDHDEKEKTKGLW